MRYKVIWRDRTISNDRQGTHCSVLENENELKELISYIQKNPRLNLISFDKVI